MPGTAWQPLHEPPAAPAKSLQGQQAIGVYHRGFLEIGLVLRLMAAQLMRGSLPDVKHLVL